MSTKQTNSDHTTCDRQASPTEVRDPLRQSRDKSVSEVPGIHAERGGQGRDGPAIIREPTGGGGGGVGHGGGDKERCLSRAGAGGERERGGALKVGGAGAGTAEEELPMEVPGRYERMRVLGRGSFGAVTLVKDHRDSKLYAMKTLNCSDKLDERQTAMEEVRGRSRFISSRLDMLACSEPVQYRCVTGLRLCNYGCEMMYLDVLLGSMGRRSNCMQGLALPYRGHTVDVCQFSIAGSFPT